MLLLSFMLQVCAVAGWFPSFLVSGKCNIHTSLINNDEARLSGVDLLQYSALKQTVCSQNPTLDSVPV